MMATIFLTSAIVITLSLGSVAFNHYIERRPPNRRADGETALWVAVGVGYTVGGGSLIFTVWAIQLGYDWHIGVVALSALLVAFIAAGIPMFWGDMRRTQAWRQTNEYLDRAERMNGKGK